MEQKMVHVHANMFAYVKSSMKEKNCQLTICYTINSFCRNSCIKATVTAKKLDYPDNW